MKQANAAAIYARISSDQTGEGLGVKRQLEDCRRLAGERGWVVAAEYVDNDISAYSGKARPNYDRMLADIEHGRVDAVLVYHLDRLTRRPAELEHFIDVCTAARVDVTTVTGDIGLGNDNGLMIARITSAMAAAESGRKSARMKRKMLQNAQMGKPNSGGARPYERSLSMRQLRYSPRRCSLPHPADSSRLVLRSSARLSRIGSERALAAVGEAVVVGKVVCLRDDRCGGCASFVPGCWDIG
ncbi:MAG: recombinase family protein [Leifsonia sp.]